MQLKASLFAWNERASWWSHIRTFITSQLRALEDFIVFEVTWKRADLAWKTLPRSRHLPKVLRAHMGWTLEETVGRHMPCPKARVAEML